ncbi:MAG TPA: response regulator [Anaerolineae bacterium]|nr:response regulator [Anaerolineae bacterium]
MLTDYRRRVLLVEDQPEVYRTLVRRLTADGYHVTLATNYADAQRALDTEHLHLAIFDIRLEKDDEKNVDGLRLLENVAALHLQDVMPCIVLTAHGTLPLALHSLLELGAAHFIPKIRKHEGYIAKLLDVVGELFEERLCIGFDLRYEGNSLQRIEQCAHSLHAANGDLPAPEALTLQVRDLLGKLFIGAEQLWINEMNQGFSGSVVLYVRPTWPNGLGQSLVVKIGRRDKIEAEKKAHHEYVEHFLPTNHATRLDDRYTRHLGALLYTLANTDAADTLEFQQFYRKAPTEKIVTALQGLVREVCWPWYQGRTPPKYENLRDLYLEAFNLQAQPDRLRQEFAALRPGVDLAAPMLTFESPGVTLPNPLRWLEDDEASMQPVCRSITHGDLHADNILINEANQCWLIDFYRTRESHILRDFVVLETDIKFRLAAALSAEEFYQLETTLVQLEQPGELHFDSTASPEALKAATVIAGLRAEAWELFGRPTNHTARQIQREYLISLLMATLNILRLQHFKEQPELQPQRERALLSAALICWQLQ